MAKKKVKKRSPPQKRAVRPKWHAVPLKGSFMILSILGFLITAYYVKDIDYRFAFMLVFTAMFIASLVSMSKAPILGN